MKDLVKGALIGVAIAAVVTGSESALTSLGGEPEHGIVRSIRPANQLCAPRAIKMPCLQTDAHPG